MSEQTGASTAPQITDPEGNGDGTAGVDAPEAQETPQDGASLASAPSPVLDRLRRSYAAHDAATRRKTFVILPGRYGGDLAFRAMPIDWDEQRKEVKRFEKRGIENPEVEMQFAATLIADACETILLRDEETGDYVPMVDAVTEFAGGAPVRFDERLADALGIPDMQGASPASICRMVYRNKQALTETFHQLRAWLAEETKDDEEDDGERPM